MYACMYTILGVARCAPLTHDASLSMGGLDRLGVAPGRESVAVRHGLNVHDAIDLVLGLHGLHPLVDAGTHLSLRRREDLTGEYATEPAGLLFGDRVERAWGPGAHASVRSAQRESGIMSRTRHVPPTFETATTMRLGSSGGTKYSHILTYCEVGMRASIRWTGIIESRRNGNDSW